MHEAGLPSEFVQRLKLIIPEDRWQGVIASFSHAKRCVFRVNTLHASTDSLLNELHQSDFTPSQVTWNNHNAIDAIIIPCEQRQALLASKWYQQGLLYSQNLSSQLAPFILNSQPGEEVLDLCAAPGGKTLQMACMMRDRGRIAAVEKVKARFFKLKANLKSQRVTCVQTYLSDGAGIWRKTPERFERVLVDAPCSSESRFRAEEPETFQHWRLKKIKEMAKKQKALIHSAIHCLKPGGTLVYSTCSFAPEENEAIIDYALKRFADAITVDPIDLPVSNLQPGLLTWKNSDFNPAVQNGVRILPNDLMDGFFLCKLTKVCSTLR